MLKIKFPAYLFNTRSKDYKAMYDIQKQQYDTTMKYMDKIMHTKDKDESEKLQSEMKTHSKRFEQQQHELYQTIKQGQKQNYFQDLKDQGIDNPEQLYKQNPGVASNQSDEQKVKAKVNKVQQQPQTANISQTPNKMEIRNLKSPINPKGQIIAIGVQKNDLVHAQYVYDALMALKPQTIITQIAPDHPFFIKTEDNYEQTWQEFVQRKKESSFIVNPNPKRLDEMILNEQKLQWLVRNNLAKHPNITMTPISISQSTMINGINLNITDVLRTPYIYAYNHPTPIVLSGYPELMYRDKIARTVSETLLLDLYRQKQDAQSKKQFNFDPMVLHPNVFIKPKVKYEVEVLKQTLYSNPRCVAIVDVNSIYNLEEEWSISSNNPINPDLRSIHKVDPLNEEGWFKKYLRKLVLLDLLSTPFLTENFIRYQCFPYECANGFNSTLIPLWDQYTYQFKHGAQKSQNMPHPMQ